MPYFNKQKNKWIGQKRIQEQKFTKAFETKAQAKQWETNLSQSLKAEKPEKIHIISLFEFASSYLDYAKKKFVTKTYKEKQSAFRNLLKKISPNTSVSDISKAMILKYQSSRLKSFSGNSVNKDRKNLVAAWNWARIYIEGIPKDNPFDVERFPETRCPRYIPQIEDFWKVLDKAENEQDRTMLLCYLYLAARRNEIFNLKVEDIDLHNKRIRLYTRKRKDGSLEYDWLPITNQLFETLKNHIAKNQGSTWVFPNPSTQLPYFAREKWMRRLCSLAAVKPFGLHSIRHLTASILSENNVPLIDIKTILRHKKLATTERYIHQLTSCRNSLSVLPVEPSNNKIHQNDRK